MDVCTQPFSTGAGQDYSLNHLQGPNVLHEQACGDNGEENLPCQFSNYIQTHHVFIILSVYQYMDMT